MRLRGNPGAILEVALEIDAGRSPQLGPVDEARCRAAEVYRFREAFYEAVGDLTDIERQAIEVARLFGLFRTHGFDRRAENDDAVPLEEGDSELVYIEAFCL